MFVFRLVPTLFLFLLLSGPVNAQEAKPGLFTCCPCGTCGPRCTCYCTCMISGTVLSYNAKLGTFTFETVPGKFKVTDVKLTSKVRGQELKEGQAAEFKMKLTGNLQNGLKYQCVDIKQGPPSEEAKADTAEFEKVMAIPLREKK